MKRSAVLASTSGPQRGEPRLGDRGAMMSRAASLPVTEDYRGEPPAGSPRERVRVALVAGSGPQSPGELYGLLLRRLRIFTYLLAGSMVVFFGLMLRPVLSAFERGDHAWAAFGLANVGLPLVVSI